MAIFGEPRERFWTRVIRRCQVSSTLGAYVSDGGKRLGRTQSFDQCDDGGARTGNHVSKRSHRQKHDTGSLEALSKSDTLVYPLISGFCQPMEPFSAACT